MAEDNGVQRSLGRIEGTQTQILSELQKLNDRLVAHTAEDTKNFSATRALIFQYRDEISDAVAKSGQERDAHLKRQDEKLDAIQGERNRFKGGVYVIAALLGSAGSLLAAIIGGYLHS